MLVDIYDVLLEPVYSEKSTNLNGLSKLVFRVNRKATKSDVKKAFEVLFSIKPLDVTVLNVKGKRKVFKGRVGVRSSYKKAVISFDEKVNLEFAKGA